VAPAVADDLIAAFDAIVAGAAGEERFATYARLRAEAPVHRSEALGAWVVARYADVRAVLEDRAAFAPVTQGPGAAVFGGGFFHWTGREHNKKAGILTRRIRSPRGLRELAPTIEGVARDVADSLPLGDPVDLKERFSMWVPLLVIARLTAIDDAPLLRHWYDTIMAGGTSSIGNPSAREAALRAMDDLKAYLRPIIEERRARPGADVVSDYVTATYEGEPLPEQEIAAIVGQLLPAGVETTERVLTSALRLLALDTALWQELRTGREDDDVLASFGAEALRLFPPIQAANRVALAPAEVAGTRVAEGEKVVCLIASANRDPGRFAEPERFDARRFLRNPDRQYTAAGDILPFGAGEHHCAGSRLAEAEIVQALRHLLRRVGRIELLDHAPPVGRLILYSPASLRVVLHPA
jgi:pulcherriminic acid synthase